MACDVFMAKLEQFSQGVGQRGSKAAGEKASILSLINEPAVVLFGQALLIMRYLRTKKRENVRLELNEPDG